MPDFEWTPEAIEAARSVLGAPCGPTAVAILALAAAVKAQPVVALPPCPTCKGKGVRPHGSDLYDWAVEGDPCPACNGSGVEPVVRVAVLRAWIEEQVPAAGDHPYDWRVRRAVLHDLSSFLDGLDATGGER